jgi:hypothetical protein
LIEFKGLLDTSASDGEVGHFILEGTNVEVVLLKDGFKIGKLLSSQFETTIELRAHQGLQFLFELSGFL